MTRPEFQVHLLNAKGIQHAQHIAGGFSNFLTYLESLCGDTGREMALVRTKLEEAAFFAKKAMASRPEHQIEPPTPVS